MDMGAIYTFSVMGEHTTLLVRGARVHNLKNITCEIPHGSLTVITGVSGSGKSSLAFDTIYAEGQRRYVESLSAYARQFLERMRKPDVDEITGLCPAIAIQQKPLSRNPRSIVATQTEIYDYLRLLFARIGRVYCLTCQSEVIRQTPDTIADHLLQLPEGLRFYVLFPLSRKVENGRSRREALSPKARLLALQQRGFTRLYVHGQVVEITDLQTLPALDETSVLVDRLVLRPDIRSRLIDSLELCYREGDGVAEIVLLSDPPQKLTFTAHLTCPRCQTRYIEPEPQLFSFNSAHGACPNCQGFGNLIGLDLNLVIPDRERSLQEGAIEPWTKPQFEWAQEELLAFCRRMRIPTDVPFSQLSREHQRWIIQGKGDFPGIRGFFEWLETKKYKLHVRVFLSKYRGYTTCSSCKGTRLRLEALAVRVGGKTLPEICAMSIGECAAFFASLTLTPQEEAIAGRLLQEIRQRLAFLVDVGLDYLTLDRHTFTLSGGEAQRIQLATNLGASLVGTLYVLDEPSIGLHPRDTQRLIRLLKHLRDLGNTVLVVEHDREMILAADHIIDLGPGAGEHGGEVVFQGTPEELLRAPSSLTGKYLRGELSIPIPPQRLSPTGRRLAIRGARAHNLKDIDVDIPLEMMVCITGVSGSGKSTLVYDVLYANLKKQRGEWNHPVGAVRRIEGGEWLDDVILVDQSPIGRTPRSNPATYLKVFDAIRELFASTREAQMRGLTPAHFSFNVPGGRCEACEGNGVVTVEMQFLADVELVCEQCQGMRFQPALLEIRYRGKSIHEVLNMTVREALHFFADVPKITRRLEILDQIGLGYIRLGQSATTLSGGEAQRLKLAAHLAKETSARTLYLFDEPTTGLHFDDIQKLIAAFRRLIAAGGSVVIIEHNLDVVKCADWIIDLGPEGGEHGGYLVAQGPPEEIMRVPESYTGQFLAAHLRREGKLLR
ncbi:MAG: excinuclease ABC subunit UvrA [Blastocatellia bacterium]|nr:excinuclease ABC subunit UvrA [Blastocatellia bacterium]MCX7752547.1 excinuclease ABC subunit UvrA [Blastocatellia bacterium]MDW8257337.1 excinuclease ABC subunit UvrA [Acidobacteriota bacterium]